MPGPAARAPALEAARPAAASPSLPSVEDAARARRVLRLAIVAAVALGILIRASLVLPYDFPLNDGGLFYQMTEEVRQARYRLPAFTAYNQAVIPFAYSPLAFYVTAVLADLTRASVPDLLRLVPLVVSCLVVVAFALLARDFIAPGATLVAAAAAFALVPRSYMWLIMGGGLTRSFGFLFAILALHQAYRLYAARDLRRAVTTAAFASLTVLSHLGTAPFLAFSIALFFVAFGRHREGLLGSIAVALGTVAVTAPWWATVVARHGVGPFIAAGATGGTIFGGAWREPGVIGLARFSLGTAEPFFPLIGALALVGAAASLTRGGWVLPAWWIVIVALEVRAGATYSTLPKAMLAGIAVTDVLLPLLGRPPSAIPAPSPPHPPRSGRPAVAARAAARWWPAVVVFVMLVAYSFLSALARDPALASEGRGLVGLSGDERAAMAWVARRTPPSGRFLVVTGGMSRGWWADRTVEWFPALARRVSVATVQGYEWLPGDAFRRQERRYDEAQACGDLPAACLDEWSRRTGVRFTHVYVPMRPGERCCASLLASLGADPRYRRIRAGPGATIFERR